MPQEHTLIDSLATPPKPYIEDPETCDDDFALFIYEHILEYTTDLIEDPTVGDYYIHTTGEAGYGVTDPIDINHGHCEAVLVYVLEAIEESRFDETHVAPLGRWYTGTDQSAHYWLGYQPEGSEEVYHFDAEAPYGLSRWFMLPNNRRRYVTMNEVTHPKDRDPREDPKNHIRGFYQMREQPEEPVDQIE